MDNGLMELYLGDLNVSEIGPIIEMVKDGRIPAERATAGISGIVEELERLVQKDPLTGLLNRRGISEAFDKEKARFDRFHCSTGIIMFDIDYFKRINDNYGHPIGDKVLIEVAGVIKKNLRATDYGGRYGGEEFVVILSELDGANTSETLDIISNRIRKAISEAKIPGLPEDVNITISGGTTILRSSDTLDSVISRADKALLQAKNEGKNKIVGFIDKEE